MGALIRQMAGFVRQVADVRLIGNGSSSVRWQTLVRQVSPLRVNDYFKLFFLMKKGKNYEKFCQL
ncbi:MULTISPECIES: hypothetical protein [unclassified Bacteroides]|jgi:hypothetical protein|uniref:hypothetical protein n=2 Tax=Bacteroides TaxID=816 RepID=UPI0011DCEDFB|nr:MULTISPECIES: hypothetical protein [unclassified Bacteroides]MCS2336353.1 hypothetical protein [Bacteroides sp. BFG-606]